MELKSAKERKEELEKEVLEFVNERLAKLLEDTGLTVSDMYFDFWTKDENSVLTDKSDLPVLFKINLVL